jgi:hypothetical protein
MASREDELVDALLRAHTLIEQMVGAAFGPVGSGLIRLHQKDMIGGGLMPTHSKGQKIIRRGRTDAKKIIKAKRKVSGYQKEFGRQMKKLIKAHPRTPRTRLMKRAHRATKKARK